MKIVLAIAAQFLLFVILFAVGSFLHPFNLHWATTNTTAATRYFIADGLLLAIGAFLAILLVQVLRKRTCDSPWTILAFVFSTAIGYALKFGYVTKDIF